MIRSLVVIKSTQLQFLDWILVIYMNWKYELDRVEGSKEG